MEVYLVNHVSQSCRCDADGGTFILCREPVTADLAVDDRDCACD